MKLCLDGPSEMIINECVTYTVKLLTDGGKEGLIIWRREGTMNVLGGIADNIYIFDLWVF